MGRFKIEMDILNIFKANCTMPGAVCEDHCSRLSMNCVEEKIGLPLCIISFVEIILAVITVYIIEINTPLS